MHATQYPGAVQYSDGNCYIPPPHSLRRSASGFDDLASVEPGLWCLERQIHLGSFARSWKGWEKVKSALKPLAGWHAQRPELCFTTAWDTAYAHLLGIFEARKPIMRTRRRRDPGRNTTGRPGR